MICLIPKTENLPYDIPHLAVTDPLNGVPKKAMRLVDSSTAFSGVSELSRAINKAWRALADSIGSVRLTYLNTNQTTKAVSYKYNRTLLLYHQKLFNKATREFSSH